MLKGILIRNETSTVGTFGRLVFGNDFSCYTGELPSRNNEKGKSCIPAGVYIFVWSKSPKHGHCYEAENVPGRSDIQIHAANWMGDKEKGFKCQLLGCIAPGMLVDQLEGQKAVISSKKALQMLEDYLERKTFELEIAWAHGVGPQEKT